VRKFVLQVGEDLREDMLELFWGDDKFQPRPVFVVLRHAHVEQIFWASGVGELIEIGSGEGVGHLACAVGAKVEEDHRVVIANVSDRLGGRFRSVKHYDGLHKLVGDVVGVTLLQSGNGIGGPRFRFAVDDGAIGQFDALPAIVAIHGVVAADERGNFADAQLAHFLLQLADKILAAVRRRVATVHETVHENFCHAGLLGHFKQREEVLDMGMYAAVAEQSHEVQLMAAAAIHGLLEQREVLELLVGDEQIEARDVHVHDASRAHVHVADFAVAHLAVGQAHERARGVNQGVGKFAQQFVIGRLAGQSDGVTGGFGAIAPAVQHGQYDGTLFFAHG
jgi:hypothetical protein